MDVGSASTATAGAQPLKSDAYASKPTAPGQSGASSPEIVASAPSGPGAPPPGLGETVDIQA